MSKFELSLSSEYVPTWTVVDAVRELFQNALDQQTVVKDNTMFFNYAFPEGYEGGDIQLPNPGILTLGNKHSVLQTSSLLLGTSTKRDDPNTIGKFGEGYKIAALVLTRLGKRLTIYNYGAKEVWTFRFVQSRKYGDVKVLTIDIEKMHFWKTVPDHDLTMEIVGITPDEHYQIIASNLHLQNGYQAIETPYGRILLSEAHGNKVFVNGLYVCDSKDFKYGYDIKPKHITIDRDRKAVGDWDLSWVTGKMWTSAGVEYVDIILQMARDNAKDVHHLHYHSGNPNVTGVAVSDFKKEYGSKAVPVTSQEQVKAARADGKKPIIVSEPLKHILESAPTDFYKGKGKVPTPLTITEKFRKWMLRHKPVLPLDAQRHFRDLLKELDEELKK